MTISIGAVVTQKNELNPKEIYQLADNALYEAKETGRNKVVVKRQKFLSTARMMNESVASCRTPIGASHPPVCAIYEKKPVLSYELFFKYGGEGGFEPRYVAVYTLSRRAPSATRTPHQIVVPVLLERALI